MQKHIVYLYEMNDLNELQFDLEINDKPFTEQERDTQKIYASMKFYERDTEYNGNFAMCQFLKALKENRENLSLEERTRRKNILLEERYNSNKKEPK